MSSSGALPGRGSTGRPRSRRSQALATALLLVATVLVTTPAAQAAVEVYPVPPTRAFAGEGHGWGHGRGMSQYGALEAARRGLAAAQILDFYYPGAPLVQQGNPLLRVQLTVNGGAPTQVLPQAGLKMRHSATGATVVLPADASVLEWRVRSDSAGMHVEYLRASDRRWVPWAFPGVGTTLQGPVAVYGSAPLVVLLPSGERRAYAGHLVSVPVGGGLMNTVNVVTMETYLRGVVPWESPSSWPAAALQAQAVAARTYAMDRVVRIAGRGEWDICDTVRCQVYGGIGPAVPSTDQAITATAGLVKTTDGRTPINAEFSSSNGGVSADGGRSYLPSKPDPYDRNASNRNSDWTATLTAAAIEARHPQVGSLRELRVVRREGVGDWGGRVAEVLLVGSAGQVRLTRETDVRFGLKSAYWVIEQPNRAPTGNFEVAQPRMNSVLVRGWTIDPDTTDPVTVRVLSDSRPVGTFRADHDRPDVGAVHPLYGPQHGFEVQVPLPSGRRSICVEALDGSGGAPVRLGCRTVDVPGDPWGNLEHVRGSIGTVEASGWVIDPDDPARPTSVHAYLDGRFAGAFPADRLRPDVRRVHPLYGADRGFSVSVRASGGNHQLCVYAMNAGPGTRNPVLGCRTVAVVAGEPRGNFERLVRDGGSVSAVGWALDPNTAAATDVHVYVDGRYVAASRASLSRPDVATAYPAYGSGHGYSVRVPAPRGSRVCVFAINVGPGSSNPSLGCRTA